MSFYLSYFRILFVYHYLVKEPWSKILVRQMTRPKYSVILKGLPISRNYGADSCKVELHAAPGGSECNVPIELNLSGLSIYSKSNEGVVLKANQILAFASKKSSGCSKPRIASFHQCIPIIPLHCLKTTIPCLHSATGPHHCLISIHHHLLTSFHR
jgi:hypothetical protein